MKTKLESSLTSRIGQNQGLILLTAFFTGMALLTMFFPLAANIPINIIIPIIILARLNMVFFERLKLSTLLLMRLLVVITVLNVVSGSTCTIIVAVLFSINILEATLTDLLKKKNYFNAISGFALVASIPFIQGDWNGTYYTMTMKGIIFWIAAYTLWNWIFVTYEFGHNLAKLHVGVLGAPIIGALLMWNPGVWFLLRGNSLTVAGITQISNKEKLETFFVNNSFAKFVDKTQTQQGQVVLMIVNLVLVGTSVLLAIY